MCFTILGQNGQKSNADLHLSQLRRWSKVIWRASYLGRRPKFPAAGLGTSTYLWVKDKLAEKGPQVLALPSSGTAWHGDTYQNLSVKKNQTFLFRLRKFPLLMAPRFGRPTSGDGKNWSTS